MPNNALRKRLRFALMALRGDLEPLPPPPPEAMLAHQQLMLTTEPVELVAIRDKNGVLIGHIERKTYLVSIHTGADTNYYHEGRWERRLAAGDKLAIQISLYGAEVKTL